MPMVETRDGSSVFVRILGRGKPVVLLHGFALDGRQWLPLIAPYLNSYQFILPDFRGHGSSALGSLHRSSILDTLCNDLNDILDHLGIERAMLGAYSMGAFVGLEFVLRDQAQRIERYLHIEVSPRFHNSPDWSFGFSPGMTEQAVRLVELWDADPIEGLRSPHILASYRALVHGMAQEAFPQNWVKQVLGIIPVRFFEPLLPDPQFTHEFFSFLLNGDFDARHRISTLKIPGLIMSGRLSHYFPWEGSEWMHQQWEQSEHVIFDRSGHGLMYSEPLKFRKAIGCFLQGEIGKVHEILQGRNWLSLHAAG